MKQNIGIVGYGYVGKAIEYGFKNQNIFIFDKYKETLSLEEVCHNSEFIFVCVPTPTFADYSGIDLSIVEEVVGQISQLTAGSEKIIIVKSTVIPGTTSKFVNKYPDNLICFNPEFLTEANYLEDFIKADRCIIGSTNKQISQRVEKLYKLNFPKTNVLITDPTSAEMVKYMTNAFLATKVIFANEIYDICQKLGIDYKRMKDLVVLDQRIYDSHLDITPERGFGKKCLPKDLVALIGLSKQLDLDSSVLKKVWQKNLEIRKVRDWEDIPFAVAKNKVKV